jgi:uncharacterized protein (TIGR02145 family)
MRITRNILKGSFIFILTFVIFSCKKDGPPEVITFEITNIDAASATGGGKITDGGGSDIVASGVCWSTLIDPALKDKSTTDVVISGNFSSIIQGLQGSTLYYVRAYATNSSGTGYGKSVSFETLNPDVVYGTMTDIDGTIYRTLEIGAQEWMAENLKVKRYKNGDNINTTKTPSKDLIKENDPKYQWAYNGTESNSIKYGRLYTWYTTADSRGLCPEGWHVPSDREWTILTDFLGGESSAQKSLKDKGFTIQYGGYRMSREFFDLDLYGIWWSSSLVENTVPGAIDQVRCRTMVNGAKLVYRDYRYKKSGVSIRCLKDINKHLASSEKKK